MLQKHSIKSTSRRRLVSYSPCVRERLRERGLVGRCILYILVTLHRKTCTTSNVAILLVHGAFFAYFLENSRGQLMISF